MIGARTCAIFFAGVVALAFSSAFGQPAGSEPFIRGTEYRPSSVCNFDRIIASPSGNEAALWASESRRLTGRRVRLAPNEVIVASFADAGSSEGVRLQGYSGGGLRAFPIRWSEDGRLFLRLREQTQRLIAITPGSPRTEDVGALDASWRSIDITAISHGGLSALTDPLSISLARNIEGTELIRGHATLGAGLQLLGVRRSDLRLVRVSGSASTLLPMGAGELSLVTAFADERFYSDGVAYLGAPTNSRENYLVHQLPLVDLSSGSVIGRFGQSQILLDRRPRLAPALDQFHRQMAASGRIVLDASVSGEVLMVLTFSGNGERRLFRVRPGEVLEQPICTSVLGITSLLEASQSRPSDQHLRLRAFGIDTAGREVAEPGRPILMVHRIAPHAATDAVLYFPGGPGETLAQPHLGPEVRHLLRPGRDVIAVGYSGTQGGGPALSRRLARLGMIAVEQDVDAVARWLQRQPYRRVFIIGSSFGAVPALVAVSRHRQRFAGAFFVAPLLRLIPPEEWVDNRAFERYDTGTQRAYEEGYFGGAAGRRTFASSLADLVVRAPLGHQHHFYFAELDPVSRTTDLPVDHVSPHRVFPRAHHETIAGLEELWTDIAEHME